MQRAFTVYINEMHRILPKSINNIRIFATKTMKSVTHLLFSIICVTILSACGETSTSANGVTQSIDATLQEITSGIESGRWESARVKAENLYTVQHNNLSPIEAAKLTIIYISLTSEPGLNFEQFHTYAQRIVELHDYAIAGDSATVTNYFKIVGGATMVEEAYENCLYIIATKQQIGNDSTITFD